MTKKQKQILRFSKIVIILVIIMILIFTGWVLYIFYNNKTEPTAMIAAFFAFMTGEVWALAKLKLAEINAESNAKKEEKKEGMKDGNSI